MFYLSYLESKSEIFQNRFLANFVQKRAVERPGVSHRLHVVPDLNLAASLSKLGGGAENGLLRQNMKGVGLMRAVFLCAIRELYHDHPALTIIIIADYYISSNLLF